MSKTTVNPYLKITKKILWCPLQKNSPATKFFEIQFVCFPEKFLTSNGAGDFLGNLTPFLKVNRQTKFQKFEKFIQILTKAGYKRQKRIKARVSSSILI